jgi:uncharacterized protein YkvS
MLHIANFCYECQEHPLGDVDPICYSVDFCDGVLGDPLLFNVVVIGGLSLPLAQNGGEMCCLPAPLADTKFFCGPASGPEDEDGNPVPIEGAPGDTVQICFFWCDPTDNIGGFQLAVCFDCCLEVVEGTFTIEDTILEAVGAEFVNHSVDNDDDADGCSLVVGILLDALPPFEGQTVPQTAVPFRIGCIDAVICEEACDLGDLAIEFCDGATGGGEVPINNIVIIGVESIQNFVTNDCVVKIQGTPSFKRGDCNFDEKCDLADAAAVIQSQFGSFDPPCDDACDTNDDGKINLADAVYILNFLFKGGDQPPAPFPDPGTDPTDDDPLDCAGGQEECL